MPFAADEACVGTFFSPVVAAVVAGCFCAGCAPEVRAIIALMASLKSNTAAAQAVCHDTMLMLPRGARGNDNIHST